VPAQVVAELVHVQPSQEIPYCRRSLCLFLHHWHPHWPCLEHYYRSEWSPSSKVDAAIGGQPAEFETERKVARRKMIKKGSAESQEQAEDAWESFEAV
jgi:hypothetical protein